MFVRTFVFKFSQNPLSTRLKQRISHTNYLRISQNSVFFLQGVQGKFWPIGNPFYIQFYPLHSFIKEYKIRYITISGRFGISQKGANPNGGRGVGGCCVNQYLGQFPQILHENENNWTEGGHPKCVCIDPLLSWYIWENNRTSHGHSNGVN